MNPATTAIDFKVWCALNLDLVAAEEAKLGTLSECPECEGDGDVLVQCDDCPHEHEHCCGVCRGFGFVKWTRDDVDQALRQAYERQLEADRARVKRALGDAA